MAMFGGEPTAAMNLQNRSRILAFKIGGTASLPQPPTIELPPMPEPPPMDADQQQIALGKNIYYDRCVGCHGINVASGGLVPDLRYANEDTHAAWDAIVLGGSLRDKGMPAFGGILSKADADAVHAFVISEAQLAYARSRAQ